MIQLHRLRDRVDLVNAPLTTGYGNTPGRDWAAATVTSSVRCLLQQNGSSEDDTARDTSTSQLVLILRPGAPISASTRVRAPGFERDLEVDGGPATFTRHGRPHHIEAQLKVAVDG